APAAVRIPPRCTRALWTHPSSSRRIDHRSLPSFPTRRSSDLQSTWQTARTVEPVPYSQFEQALAEGRVAEVTVGETTITGRLKRSEEHTSELQSRENLVCRLLLEKKKQRCDRTRAPCDRCGRT